MRSEVDPQQQGEEQALLQQQLAQPLLRQRHELTAEQASPDQQQRQKQQQQKQQQHFYEELQQSSSHSSTRNSKKTSKAGVNAGRYRARCCCCCCDCSSSSSTRRCCCVQNALPAEALSSKVLLNVGGRAFATTYSTLRNFGPHYLSRCLSPPWRQGETREIFIDRNGDSFSFVLDFLRNGALCCSNKPWLLQQLLLEARFFCIRPLEQEIEDRLKRIRLEGVAVRCEEADRLAATAVLGGCRAQDCLATLVPTESPMLQQQLLHLNFCRDPETNSHGRRSSRSSEGGSRSGSSESDGCTNAREPLTAAASAAATASPGETPQERAKLAQIAAAAELAARAESLRRSLVNDDPEPPEPQAVKDLGERVLLTDEDF
ncbi:potassium channel tetramerisation domain containing protein, putative [Eimeria acervulina]|uniref:Potassium channel tetramerisation domain containing protein, putative n=1 Tax=Eimeria acervulina TaxID=5801 RepID=U6GP31_EIMAC|nr:potassium channel tetramerisation domain containing protein, putative [Eimeria acervulina]CDI80374.1 potassium channel tetramerisation domain containing protein, putative [Eimeria acervulina]